MTTPHGRDARPPAFVCDADDPNNLSVIYALASAGVEVVAASPEPRALGFSSRYCAKRLVCPDPSREPDRFLDFLLERVEPGVIIPYFDTYTLLIARHQERLREAGFHTFLTAYPDLENVVFKDKLGAVAADDPDLPVPRTLVLREAELDAAAKAMPLPWVLKVIRTKHTRRVDRAEDLAAGYRALDREVAAEGHGSYYIIAQRFIPGDRIEHVCQFIDRDGAAVGSIVAKRLRAFVRPDGAQRDATLMETIDAPELSELAHRFARRHRLRGLMELEAIRHRETGRYELFDVNNRVWGWVRLGIRFGVNFPHLYYQAALGREYTAPVAKVPPGRYYLRLFTTRSDPLAALTTWKNRHQTAGQVLGSFLALARRPAAIALDYGVGSDPLPRLRLVARAVRYLLRLALRAARQRLGGDRRSATRA